MGTVAFFQFINERYEWGSTVPTSKKGLEEWGAIPGDEVLAAMLLDRLLHDCRVVNIRGSGANWGGRFTKPPRERTRPASG